jgi:hypothetical protein
LKGIWKDEIYKGDFYLVHGSALHCPNFADGSACSASVALIYRIYFT